MPYILQVLVPLRLLQLVGLLLLLLLEVGTYHVELSPSDLDPRPWTLESNIVCDICMV